MIYYPPPTIPRILALNSTGDIGGLSQIPVDSIYQAPITIFSVGKIGALTPNATRFLLPNFCESTDESFSAYVVPQDGNIDQLVCRVNIPPGAGDAVYIIVCLNGSMSALATSIVDTATYSTDLLNSIDVVRGDLITVNMITSTYCAAENLQVMLRHNTGAGASPTPPA